MAPPPAVQPSRHRAYLLAIAAVAAAVVAFWWPCLLGGQAPLLGDAQANMLPWRAETLPPDRPAWDALWWDGMAQYFPWRTFCARTLSEGLVPLWNPHQFCGTPMLANGQSAVFYPPNWLFLFIDARYAFGLLAALHYFLAGLFMLLLARELRLSASAGAVGAFAFMFGGFMVSWTHLPTLINTAAWLPAAALCIERLFRRRGIADGALLVGVLTLAMLAGHLQIAAYVWLYAVAHIAARGAWALYRRAWRPVVLAAIALPVAMGLSAGQLLPTMELARLSPRGSVEAAAEGFAAGKARAFTPAMLPLLVSPLSRGTPAEWVITGPGRITGAAFGEFCGYVGKLTLLLALAALVLARRKHAWLLGLIALCALVTAMAGPSAWLLYHLVPGMAQAGGFTRMLCVFTFGVAMLAAIGVDASASRLASVSKSTVLPKLARYIAPAAALLVLLDVGSFGRAVLPMSPRERVYPDSPLTTRLAGDSGDRRVLAVTRRDNWTIPMLPEALLPPNAASAYGYDSVQGYDSLLPKVYDRLASAIDEGGIAPPANGNMRLLEDTASSALDAAAVKWVVAAASSRVDDPGLREAWRVSGCVVYENTGALPRARLEPTDADASAVFLRLGSDPCRVTADLTGGAAGEVVIADTCYPGWQAFVDGVPAQIRLHEPSFRSVSVSETSRTVDMIYAPSSFSVGAFIALLSAGVVAGCLTWGRGRRSRTLAELERPSA